MDKKNNKKTLITQIQFNANHLLKSIYFSINKCSCILGYLSDVFIAEMEAKRNCEGISERGGGVGGFNHAKKKVFKKTFMLSY